MKYIILYVTLVAVLCGRECREFSFRNVVSVGGAAYITYRFVPNENSIFFARGRPVGNGYGVWAAFVELHDYAIYIDSGSGYVKVKRNNLWAGLSRCYIFYSEPNEAISTVGISSGELIKGLDGYFSGKWPSEKEIRVYIKVGVTTKPRLGLGGQEENPYVWVPSEAIILKIANSGKKIEITGYCKYNQSYDEGKNEEMTIYSITPIEIEQN